MLRVEKTVFISYRRTNVSWALAIYQHLTLHGFDVFFDFTGIPSGDFERVIIENIRSRAHFLVLLTPSALERCGEPGDWFRREIVEAMACRRNIVPMMLDSFDFGAPGIAPCLTGELALLKRYNGLSVPAEYFDAAMGKLREKFLHVPLESVPHPPSEIAQIAAKAQQTAAAIAPPVKERELTVLDWLERGYTAASLEEELRCYGEAIRLKPDYAAAYSKRGNVRHQQGDLDGALEDFDEAIRLAPDYAIAYNSRGIVRHEKGDLDGALKDFDEAIRLRPDDGANHLYQHGNVRGDDGKLDAALGDCYDAMRFAESVGFEPHLDLATAYNDRGNARRDKGDLDGALKDFDEAIRLRPDGGVAYCNRGNTRHDKGELDRALNDFDEAIRLEPDDAIAYHNRGAARHEIGDLDGALEDFNHAIRLKPDDAAPYSNRGAARYEKGDVDGALKDFDEAIRLQPDLAAAYNNRGTVRRKKGDVDGALRDFDQAIRLKLVNTTAYNDRGNARQE